MEDSAEHFAEAWLRDHGNLLFSYALARVGGDTAVVSVMAVNNETGAVNPVAEIVQA